MGPGSVMQLAASGLFGLAVMLLFLAAINLVQRQRLSARSGGTLTSMRRAEMATSSASPLPSSVF